MSSTQRAILEVIALTHDEIVKAESLYKQDLPTFFASTRSGAGAQVVLNCLMNAIEQ